MITAPTVQPAPARLTRAPFATVFRHEWRRTRGILGVSTGIAALAVALATLLAVTGWPLVSFLGSVVAIIVAVVLVPALQLELAVDYWRSSYGRTGYFTQSLPIRGATIYWAKFAWVTVVTVVGILITIGLGSIAWFGFAIANGGEANPFVVMGEFLAQITQVLSPWMLVGVVLLYLGMYLTWPVQYLFAASVGSETPLNRLGAGGPVLVFVGLYFVSQLLAMLGMFLIPFGVGVVADGTFGIVPFDLIGSMATDVQADDVMPLGFLPPLLLVSVVCVWRTVYSWRRKVSLV